MKQAILTLALAAVALPSVAVAQPYPDGSSGAYRDGRDRRDGYSDGYDQNGYNRDGYDRDGYDRRGTNGDGYNRDGYRDRDNQYDRRYYDQQGRYVSPRPLGRNDHAWRGNDGRYYCRRNNGTTGLIVGGVAGGVLGNIIDGGRHRTLGTLLGAGGGALLGRSVDRGDLRCR